MATALNEACRVLRADGVYVAEPLAEGEFLPCAAPWTTQTQVPPPSTPCSPPAPAPGANV